MYYSWKPYVSVAQRKAAANRLIKEMAKKGKLASPIVIEGRKITNTFWGTAWCENLESYSDFENRLPRGRTYVRNGSVIDLTLVEGKINALVSGSEVYKITIDVQPTSQKTWAGIKKACSGSIDSLMDLLQGRFADSVMSKLTNQKDGLFPKPSEMKFRCSCPDWASMCKHVAAVLYGVGARLDHDPELLFKLRGVDHFELLAAATDTQQIERAMGGSGKRTFEGDVEAVFGIELDSSAREASPDAAEGMSTVRKRSGGNRQKPAVRDNGESSATKTDSKLQSTRARKAPVKLESSSAKTAIKTSEKASPSAIGAAKKNPRTDASGEPTFAKSQSKKRKTPR
jgi:uncharacterized Zn finger protein